MPEFLVDFLEPILELFTAAFWSQYGGLLWENTLDTLVMVIVSTLFAYLLGLQYSYIDDEKNTSRYLKEAQQLLKGTPYEEVIRDLLKERKKNR